MYSKKNIHLWVQTGTDLTHAQRVKCLRGRLGPMLCSGGDNPEGVSDNNFALLKDLVWVSEKREEYLMTINQWLFVGLEDFDDEDD